MFVFEFEEALFAFEYTRPPFAFALLFERYTARPLGTSTFFSAAKLHIFFQKSTGYAGIMRGGAPFRASTCRFYVFTLLRYKLYRSFEGQTRAEARVRVRRGVARIRVHETANRIRIVIRAAHSKASYMLVPHTIAIVLVPSACV